jgi:hypothetical protein
MAVPVEISIQVGNASAKTYTGIFEIKKEEFRSAVRILQFIRRLLRSSSERASV